MIGSTCLQENSVLLRLTSRMRSQHLLGDVRGPAVAAADADVVVQHVDASVGGERSLRRTRGSRLRA